MNVFINLDNTNHDLVAVQIKAIVPHWLISDLSKPWITASQHLIIEYHCFSLIHFACEYLDLSKNELFIKLSNRNICLFPLMSSVQYREMCSLSTIYIPHFLALWNKVIKKLIFIFLGITVVKISLVKLKFTLNIYILQKLPTAHHWIKEVKHVTLRLWLKVFARFF